MLNKSIKYVMLLALLAGLYSCNGGKNNVEATTERFPAFAGFPQKQFYDITLGEALPDVEKKLTAIGFEKTDSSGSARFLHKADSMEIILPDKTPVNSFKVFFRSRYYLDEGAELQQLFREKAVFAGPGANFNVYSYDLENLEYKLTVFSQPTYLRLYYEQNLSK